MEPTKLYLGTIMKICYNREFFFLKFHFFILRDDTQKCFLLIEKDTSTRTLWISFNFKSGFCIIIEKNLLYKFLTPIPNENNFLYFEIEYLIATYFEISTIWFDIDNSQ